MLHGQARRAQRAADLAMEEAAGRERRAESKEARLVALEAEATEAQERAAR